MRTCDAVLSSTDDWFESEEVVHSAHEPGPDFPIFRRIRSGTAGSTAAFSGLRMRPSGARPSGRNRASEMLPFSESLPLLRGGDGGDAGAAKGEAGDGEIGS